MLSQFNNRSYNIMIMTSVDNIMTLFDTLTHSGHINAMHMLGIVVEQIASFRRLPTKLDEEVKVWRHCTSNQQNIVWKTAWWV